MLPFYYHLPEINSTILREKINFEIERKNLFENFQETYKKIDYKDFYKFKWATDLELFLYNNKFPGVDYILIFNHVRSQDIHIDGSNSIRLASLNLPLTNYTEKTFLFYSVPLKELTKGDAFYYYGNQHKILASFKGTDCWTLINSGIPHNMTVTDYSIPIRSLCVRFKGNPSIYHIIKKIS